MPVLADREGFNRTFAAIRNGSFRPTPEQLVALERRLFPLCTHCQTGLASWRCGACQSYALVYCTRMCADRAWSAPASLHAAACVCAAQFLGIKRTHEDVGVDDGGDDDDDDDDEKKKARIDPPQPAEQLPTHADGVVDALANFFEFPSADASVEEILERYVYFMSMTQTGKVENSANVMSRTAHIVAGPGTNFRRLVVAAAHADDRQYTTAISNIILRALRDHSRPYAKFAAKTLQVLRPIDHDLEAFVNMVLPPGRTYRRDLFAVAVDCFLDGRNIVGETLANIIDLVRDNGLPRNPLLADDEPPGSPELLWAHYFDALATTYSAPHLVAFFAFMGAYSCKVPAAAYEAIWYNAARHGLQKKVTRSLLMNAPNGRWTDTVPGECMWMVPFRAPADFLTSPNILLCRTFAVKYTRDKGKVAKVLRAFARTLLKGGDPADLPPSDGLFCYAHVVPPPSEGYFDDFVFLPDTTPNALSAHHLARLDKLFALAALHPGERLDRVDAMQTDLFHICVNTICPRRVFERCVTLVGEMMRRCRRWRDVFAILQPLYMRSFCIAIERDHVEALSDLIALGTEHGLPPGDYAVKMLDLEAFRFRDAIYSAAMRLFKREVATLGGQARPFGEEEWWFVPEEYFERFPFGDTAFVDYVAYLEAALLPPPSDANYTWARTMLVSGLVDYVNETVDNGGWRRHLAYLREHFLADVNMSSDAHVDDPVYKIFAKLENQS